MKPNAAQCEVSDISLWAWNPDMHALTHKKRKVEREVSRNVAADHAEYMCAHR